MRPISGFLLLVLLVALSGRHPLAAQNFARPDEREVSLSVDGRDIQPILERISTVLDRGFSRFDADDLARVIAGQTVDDEKTVEFNVVFHGKPALLRVRASMDDETAHDVKFFTTPELADTLKGVVSSYLGR